MVTKGSNRCRGDVVGHAGAIVAHAEFQRQSDRALRAMRAQTDAGAEGGGEFDLAVDRVANGLGGVLDEIQEGLHQLVAIAREPAAATDRNSR